MYANYKGKLINLIDTPGYPDFVGGALQAIPAGDLAVIVISAANGIGMNTRKMFQAATAAGKARMIVINRIDADNIDLKELVGQIQETFGTQCRCANLPGNDKNSVIDCILNSTGDSPVMDAEQAHTELMESAIEADEALMESYLGGEEISPDKLGTVIIKAIAAGTLIPIVFTDARHEVGVTELLDAIVNYAPSPADAAPAVVKDGDNTVEVKPDPNGPLCGIVFRVGFDPRSNMKYSALRIFSGQLTPSTQLMVNDARKAIRPGHPLKMQGVEPKEVEAGVCGDIVSLAKIDELHLRRSTTASSAAN